MSVSSLLRMLGWVMGIVGSLLWSNLIILGLVAESLCDRGFLEAYQLACLLESA